ncbi:MAG: hypothetical protein ACK46L_17340 [Synechococcaceae cyanobacterium]
MTPSATGQLRRPPLPLTSLAILLLLAVPVWWLSRWPRPKAQGLERLMAVSSLLQSFPAMPERRLPQLWRERLGDQLGTRLWRLQRRTWWQLWGPHADGAPYLVIPDPFVARGGMQLGPSADRRLIEQRGLRVGNLLVLAPDPLAQRLLRDQLLPRQRPARGLRRQCAELLVGGQVVFWTPTALGAMLGPIAPLFQRYQEGCLRLSLAPDNRVLWQGVTSSVDGLQAAPPRWTPPRPEQPALEEGLLLELRGSALEPLLQGLVSRELIREPLTERYGLNRQRLERLQQSPFRLRLRPLRQGPFLAGMDLQLALSGAQADWQPVLDHIAESLAEQGLQRAAGDATRASDPSAPSAPSAPPSSSPSTPAVNEANKSPGSASKTQAPQPALSLWTRPNGDVIGGWRWIPSRSGSSQLMLYLGSPPTTAMALAPLGERPGADLLLLRARPRPLAERGLLPALLPELVQQAGQLQIQASGRQGKGSEAAFSLLTGQLQMEPR